MRHRKSGRHFNRNSSHRKAMMQNLTNSLFKHELIKTTVPKAKELRRVAEPLITMAKEDSVHTRRLAFSRMRDKEMVGKLFTVLGPRYQARPGGYLRILKCGFRAGDNAPMAYVELVGRGEEVSAPAPKPAKKKATKAAAPKAEKKAESAPTSGSDMTDIEGIGKAMATKLETAGVNSISSLLDSCGTTDAIAELAEKSGVSVNNLTKWSIAADLLRIEGIEPQRAELLVATGITSVQDLATKDSSELANAMIELNKEKNLTKTEDTAETVATWISNAAELPTKLS